ncbi:hypothetical protein [Streptomyces sp. KL118A]|uniref:hypothetical protein n=1 Tax=Streptomyces sp. KL118A TaxID=3045153 RepID=UPI00278C3FBA|nr:hypothetical protein [Streptomyces sp. KL118A]
MTHSHDTHCTHGTHRARGTDDVRDTPVDVLLSSYDVADDGRIALHVLGPTRGVPAAVWTHDPERLRRLLRGHTGPAQWQPRRNLLRLGCDTAGATLVGVATEAGRAAPRR